MLSRHVPPPCEFAHQGSHRVECLRDGTPVFIRPLLGVDGLEQLAFAARIHDENESVEVGTSGFVADTEGQGGKITIAAAPEWHGTGLDRALLTHLLGRLRMLGYTYVHMTVPAADLRMRTLARDLDFCIAPVENDTSMVVCRRTLSH